VKGKVLEDHAGIQKSFQGVKPLMQKHGKKLQQSHGLRSIGELGLSEIR
jgi:hypothetical protein